MFMEIARCETQTEAFEELLMMLRDYTLAREAKKLDSSSKNSGSSSRKHSSKGSLWGALISNTVDQRIKRKNERRAPGTIV
jgi:hypothetical protein